MKGKVFNRVAYQEEFLKVATEEQIAENKQRMFETSHPLEKEVEKKLYHASPVRNFRSIMDKGLLQNPVWGEVYLVGELKQAKRFQDKPFIIFEIDSSKLDMSRMKLSKDHDRRTFPFDCYQYYGDIPAEAIINFKTIS